MNDQTNLEFYANGPAFKEGGVYDLRAVERLLTDYRRLVDSLLPLAFNQKTLTDRLRNEVQYQISFEAGSWRTILQFVLEHKEVFAAIVASDNAGYVLADQIAKLIKSSLELWRKFEEILKNGKKPQIQIGSGNSQNFPLSLENVSTANGNIIIVNQPIQIIAAQVSKSALDNLVKAVDGTNVESLAVISGDTKEIITSDDHRITGSLKEELASNIEIVGRLDMVAFTAHKGHLLTGNGRYPVTWDENIRQQIRSNADTDGIAFTVKPVIDNKRMGDEPIGFHILRVHNPQQRLL